MGSGDVAGGVTNAMFQGTGAFIKMFPGMGLVGDIVGGIGNVASKGVAAGGNAIENAGIKAEYDKIKSGKVDRDISDVRFDEIVKSRVPDLRQKALDEFFLFKTKIDKVEPFCFEFYYINSFDDSLLIARGRDGIDRTNFYRTTLMFLTTEELFIFHYTMDVLSCSEEKTTGIYAWKDIKHINTTCDTIAGREQRFFEIYTSTPDCIKCPYKDNDEARKAISYIYEQHKKSKQNNMGDNIKIENVQNLTFVNKSNVVNSFNKVREQFDEKTANVIKQIAEIVEKSKNDEAKGYFEDFNEEINKPEPKKSRLKSFWNSLTSVLPVLSSTVSIVEKIMKIIN